MNILCGFSGGCIPPPQSVIDIIYGPAPFNVWCQFFSWLITNCPVN